MGHVSAATDKEIDTLLDEYWTALQDSPLADSSVEDHFYFAYAFVRWSRGEFEPGATIRSTLRVAREE